MEKENSFIEKIDFGLLFIMFLMAIVSYIAISSAPLPPTVSHINFAMKQVQWYIISIFVVVAVMILDFDRFKMITWYLYGFGMLLLLGLELNFPPSAVQTIKGATSWYKIPGGNFQPSELMKIFYIITLAHVISKHNEHYLEKTIREDFLLLGKIALLAMPPILLLVKQPDLGMTMVFTAITGTMVLVSGIRWRIIFALVATGVLAGSTLVYIYFNFTDFFNNYILDEYQLDRFYGWLAPYEYPTQGYQLIKSLLAIGSGQLQGKGYTNTEVYLPEAHTDFIFGVIGEQFGFVGASLVLSLFFLLIYRMVQIALDSNDPFGSYLVTGVAGMITFQVFQNVGMTIQLMPITGLPLPFISYGGSSLVTYMIAIGLVLNVRSRTKKYMFD